MSNTGQVQTGLIWLRLHCTAAVWIGSAHALASIKHRKFAALQISRLHGIWCTSYCHIQGCLADATKLAAAPSRKATLQVECREEVPPDVQQSPLVLWWTAPERLSDDCCLLCPQQQAQHPIPGLLSPLHTPLPTSPHCRGVEGIVCTHILGLTCKHQQHVKLVH